MIRQNKWKLIVSSAIILLPLLAGILLMNFLPDSAPIHWGLDGEADGWGNPLTVVLITTPIFLILHWACVLITFWDNRKNNQSKKILGMTCWIIPVLSCFVFCMLYVAAIGKTIEFASVVFIFLGILFAVMGNYMPKTKQNRTFGLKLTWTLASEENWNRTHRFGGKVWVIGGMLMIFGVFLPIAAVPFVLIGTILVMAGIPTLYSYLLYKKQVKAGEVDPNAYRTATSSMPKWAKVLVSILIVAILAGSFLICFTGNVTPSCGDDALTVEATYWNDLVIRYEDIESIEYREGGVDGTRVSGFGTPRLLLGNFANEEFGNYTRYTYTKVDPCVVLKVKGKILVIGAADAVATRAFYDDLQTRVGK